jgi:aspartyl-tRNA(Asn)/glutamyl-tRNA(Gln) amidotransferase subunit C
MTQLTINEVKRHAGLARLAMTDVEAEMFAGQLEDMIQFANKLQEADTEQVAPMTHPLPLYNVLRKDIPTDALNREEMLKSVKEHEAGQIKVPTII